MAEAGRVGARARDAPPSAPARVLAKAVVNSEVRQPCIERGKKKLKKDPHSPAPQATSGDQDVADSDDEAETGTGAVSFLLHRAEVEQEDSEQVNDQSAIRSCAHVLTDLAQLDPDARDQEDRDQEDLGNVNEESDSAEETGEESGDENDLEG
jgi:hypothetical protein